MPEASPTPLGTVSIERATDNLSFIREVFVEGCGLPQAWSNLPHWTQLDTHFDSGLKFLLTWASWRNDMQRSQRLHYVALQEQPILTDALLEAISQHETLRPLAQALAQQYFGLTPGLHRITLENGLVLLTLCIGEPTQWLRRERWSAQGVYLDGLSLGPCDTWNDETLKGLARHCRTGTQLSTWHTKPWIQEALRSGGLAVQTSSSTHRMTNSAAHGEPKALTARYEHRWTPSSSWPLPRLSHPETALIVGAGLAGAGVAHALAERGWKVTVLDMASHPAAGASGLPAGLFCPHVSPDDSVLSRLSRAGIRVLRPLLERYLHKGEDWAPSGVLEHRVDPKKSLPTAINDSYAAWSQLAHAQTPSIDLLPESARALWHSQAGWLRPARLVQALLTHPNITWTPESPVHSLQLDASGNWLAHNAQGHVLARATHAVIAAGFASKQLLESLSLDAKWDLRAVRGQLFYGHHPSNPEDASHLPAIPVNGHGALIAHLPTTQGKQWVLGATFERGETQPLVSAAEKAQGQADQWKRLQSLLPNTAPALAPFLESGEKPVGHFCRVRCTVPDRLPVVGVVDAQRLPRLFVSSAMGARGLTLSMLCGEWLAAQIHGEPLPVDTALSRHLDASRLFK